MRLIDADAMLQNENEAYNKSLVKTEGTELALPNLIAHLKISKLIEETPTETATENKPLTLEQLRQMDGEPVWTVPLDGTGCGEWTIIAIGAQIEMLKTLSLDTAYEECNYGKTWLAYARRPEVGSKEEK